MMILMLLILLAIVAMMTLLMKIGDNDDDDDVDDDDDDNEEDCIDKDDDEVAENDKMIIGKRLCNCILHWDVFFPIATSILTRTKQVIIDGMKGYFPCNCSWINTTKIVHDPYYKGFTDYHLKFGVPWEQSVTESD